MKEFKMSAREISLNCHGRNFLCIVGRHINGGFVAFMNWGVAAELSAHIDNVEYNRDKILAALLRSPEVLWLPSDPDAQSAIARDLAMMLSDYLLDS